MQEKPGILARLIATSFTIQIIQKGPATSGGRNPNARLNIRKTGTLSAGAFVFTRSTACRCSEGLWRDEFPLVLDAQKNVPPVRNRVVLRKCA